MPSKPRPEKRSGHFLKALCQEFWNLLTNAVITWNTLYMSAALEQRRDQGLTVADEHVRRLSPARYEHINPYGKCRFALDASLNTHPPRRLSCAKVRHRLPDMFSNRGGTPRRIDLEPESFANGPLRRADHDLQLGGADLDSDDVFVANHYCPRTR